MAVLSADSGSSILFDDVSIDPKSTIIPIEEDHDTDYLAFDMNLTQQTFLGFGAQISADSDKTLYQHQNAGYEYGIPDGFEEFLYPNGGTQLSNIEQYRYDGLRDLNLKFIRIEWLWDAHYDLDLNTTQKKMDRLRSVRAATDALGIDWIYMVWSAPTLDMGWSVADPALLPPENFVDGNQMLINVSGFANWWVAHVEFLYQQGIPVEYIELMNEPDSEGRWSTGITPVQFNELVTMVRAGLDTSSVAGVPNVQIMGPGLASMNTPDSDLYFDSFDTAGNQAIDVWSTHVWEDDALGTVPNSTNVYPTGGNSLEGSWYDRFDSRIYALDTAIGKSRQSFVSEFATKQNVFHDVIYPEADSGFDWNKNHVVPYYTVVNTMPFAVQSYENTWATLNSGASSAVFWQLNDEVDLVVDLYKSWGMIGLQGEKKPIYYALESLFSKLPIGAKVLTPSAQMYGLISDTDVTTYNETYGGAVVKDGKIIFGLANHHNYDKTVQVTFRNVSGSLSVVSAEAFVQTHKGERDLGEPDEGQILNVANTIQSGLSQNGTSCILNYIIPANSTLTVELD